MVGVHRGEDDDWEPAEGRYVYLQTGPPRQDGPWAPVLTTVVVLSIIVYLFSASWVAWAAALVFIVALALRFWLTVRKPPGTS